MIDGPYKNRLLWSRLNLDNPNAQAVQIAQGELSAICRAVGVMQPKDSIELHNLPLLITREVQEARGHRRRGERDQGATPRRKRPRARPSRRRRAPRPGRVE